MIDEELNPKLELVDVWVRKCKCETTAFLKLLNLHHNLTNQIGSAANVEQTTALHRSVVVQNAILEDVYSIVDPLKTKTQDIIDQT